MDKYSVVQLAREKGGLPAPIWKLRKHNVLILEKKPDCLDLWVELLI